MDCCEDFLQRDRMQAVPDVGHPHENKEQELIAVARNIIFTCFHQIVLSPRATIPLHLLSNTDWWLCLDMPKSGKGSQEKSHWKEKDMVNQVSVIVIWSCKHPVQDKEAEINEKPSTSVIIEAYKCAHHTHTCICLLNIDTFRVDYGIISDSIIRFETL